MVRLTVEVERSAGRIPALGVPRPGSQTLPGFNVCHDGDLRVHLAGQQEWRPGDRIAPLKLHDGSHAMAGARRNGDRRFSVSPASVGTIAPSARSERLGIPASVIRWRQVSVRVNKLIEEATMAPITRIDVHLITSNRAGAGTIGPVYVGTCRREFGINHGDLDFTPGHDFTYIFGDGANVVDAADNDAHSNTARHERRDTVPEIHPPRIAGCVGSRGSPNHPEPRSTEPDSSKSDGRSQPAPRAWWNNRQNPVSVNPDRLRP